MLYHKQLGKLCGTTCLFKSTSRNGYPLPIIHTACSVKILLLALPLPAACVATSVSTELSADGYSAKVGQRVVAVTTCEKI